MNEKELAQILYNDAIRIADEHEAPRSAIAAAMFRAATQIYIDDAGPIETGAWLMREANAFRDALNKAN